MTARLSNIFIGIAAKRLSDVETRPEVSNQHEINGINDLKVLLGSDKKTIKGTFIYLSDTELNLDREEGNLTWYNAREKHPTRTEYRLYYPSNNALARATTGDLLIIGLTRENTLALLIAPKDSTFEHQLLWLFGIEHLKTNVVIKEFSRDSNELNYAEKQILTSLGIEVSEAAPNYLDQIIYTFGEKFPLTWQFSEFARSTVSEVSPIEAPDETLITWLEREELLFKTLENHLVSKKLMEGFGDNAVAVENFISFSLSVQNRRKSRAGFAFENHLAYIFDQHNIKYSKGAKTERNNKPDFLFPSRKYYNSSDFPTELLSMLGVKTTAKDRWRQVLSEADKIERKHLITLEPAISQNQTDEMKAQNLQLIVPAPILHTFSKGQQSEIISLKDFIDFVKTRQEKISS